MGLVYADIELINPKEQTLKPIKINALVDTGAITPCIPEHIVLQLIPNFKMFDILDSFSVKL